MLWHILSHSLLTVFNAFAPPPPESERRRQAVEKKWLLLLVGFCLVWMLSRSVVRYRFSRTDILTGEAAVRGFLKANITGFIMLFVCLMVYILLVFLRRARDRGSLVRILTGAVILISLVMSVLAIRNISDDLKHPRTARVKEYVLCTLNGAYYLGIEDRGEYPLLAVPAEDFAALSKGQEASVHTDSEIYLLTAGSESPAYQDVRLYTDPVTVTYYFNSAIFLECGMEKT